MVDNIKIGMQNINIDRNIVKQWGNKNPHIKIVHDYPGKNGNRNFHFDVYKNPTSCNLDNKKSSFMRAKYFEKDGKQYFSLENSLRKWHFGKLPSGVLNQEKLIECLSILSEILFLDSEFIYQLNVYQIEIGRTFLLPKSGIRLLHSVYGHPYFKKRNDNFDGSIYLNAKNIGIIIYDKLKEMYDKQCIKKNTYEKIGKNKALIRIELKISKLSGVPYANKHFRTISDICINGDLLTEYLEKEILKIEFIDFITEEQANLLLSKNEKGIFKNFFAYKWIEENGIGKALKIIDTFVNNAGSRHKRKEPIRELFKQLNIGNEMTNQNFVKELISKK
ncbi:MAG TPA: hypothetical protein VIV55_00865 [Flavobacterium sp.]